jgi:hypothetical protein
MNTAKWTDIIANEAIDHFLEAVEERRRLVDTGLFTNSEYEELCDFTGFFSCDYDGRFLWCKSHNVIEYRGRSAWSKMWYSSPVDHILTVYGNSDVNVKGYKDGKHVFELHFSNLSCWDDYQREVTDKYHLLDNDPDFLGRRDDMNGINWIGKANGINGAVEKYALQDETYYLLMTNKDYCEISGVFLSNKK